MRNSVAVIAVAVLGLYLALANVVAVPELFTGAIAAAPYLLVVIAGIVLIVLRRPIAAWIVRGADDDTGALAFGAIRVIGLLLLFSMLRGLALVLNMTMMPRSELMPHWLPMTLAVNVIKLTAAVVLLFWPATVARVLDAEPEQSERAIHIQSILFGAIALWMLIDGIPQLLRGSIEVWRETQREALFPPSSMFWSLTFPSLAAAFLQVVIAGCVFAGRQRLAAWWHRVHPMGAKG